MFSYPNFISIFKGVRVKKTAPCIVLWFTFIFVPLMAVATPRFDPTALLQEVLIPADAAIGAIVYRLRASDPSFDYPLVFTMAGKTTTFSVDSLNCTRFNSVCQSNVILRRRLEPGRFYDFTVHVNSVHGDAASLNCSFRATNATTPIAEIFPGAPTLLMVSENSRRNTEIATIQAKGNPALPRPVLLELWGSPQFGLHQRLITQRDAEGTVLLLAPLDYETRTVHHLAILANDPWTETDKDTRNIASWPLLVAVLDEQDTPPVFTLAPPTTKLSSTLRPGDLVLRVHAEDGDRGKPRDVRYGLVSEGNPFAAFFNISEETGELRLARPLSDILSMSHTGEPILLTVIAEEVRSNPLETPSQSSTVRLALIPPGLTAASPQFGLNEYSTLLDENAATGTILKLPQAEITAQPGDVVALELMGCNGTFEISPNVVDGHATFRIAVNNPKLLDYEMWHAVHCFIIAKEVGAGNFSTRARLNVLLNDINDNIPQFTQSQYEGSVVEGARAGTTVLRVEAVDADREPGSKISYTRLTGPGARSFHLDSESGVITVSDPQGLDAQKSPTMTFSVEAADEKGKGHTATATITVHLVDINDQTPQFEKNLYEFILNPDKTRFTSKAFIKATDGDLSPPNNEVHYELINAVDNLYLDETTGELIVSKQWTSSDVAILRARAWDGGVPRLSSECEIRIYPPEGQARKMVFIVPGTNPDRESVMSTLRALTGGRIVIDEIRPYSGYEPGATDVSGAGDAERSVVVATVTYSKDSVVDVNRIQQILDDKRHQQASRDEIRTDKAGSLWWILLLLILLLLLAALVLILCCICEGCPLYVPPKRRKAASAEIQKLVVKGSGNGRESKSVQVAEWFGRREAWTPEQVLIDTEAESLRRHEMERGSDRGGKRMLRQQHVQQQEPFRDQYYIREGNTDILRLVTRGEQQRPVTLVAEPTYLSDSGGKDILMRRYIDQQQSEAAKAQVLLPNAVNKLQMEHELLEASLRQQNAMLRQILLDRERDLRLETQSLPAGTQTDQDAGTQTEPEYMRPPRRRVYSDHDASDNSDDDLAMIRARARRRHGRKDKPHHTRRKITTPIQEESELEIRAAEKSRRASKTTSSQPKFKQTRTSELRQKRASSEQREKSSSKSGRIRKEVLREISASLDHSDKSNNSDDERIKDDKGLDSEDSLNDDTSPRSEKTTDSGKHKYHSESDLRRVSSKSRTSKSVKSQSHSDLSKSDRPADKKKSTTTTTTTKRTSRYMEWYNKSNKDKAKKTDKNQDKVDVHEDELVKETMKKASSRLMKDTESSSRKKVEPKLAGGGPEHPLLQHSEHRFEAHYPLVRRPEEDADSGIALARPPIAQKKSVFTIAYDDMHTRQLRPDSSTPPL